MVLKNNLIKFTIILIGIIAIYYFLRTGFVEYNIKKSISACMMAKKQTSKSFNLEKAKKFCEKEINKTKHWLNNGKFASQRRGDKVCS